MSSTDEKREEFLSGKQRYRGPNRVVILVFLLVAVVGVTAFVQLTRSDVEVPRRWQGGTYNIGRPVDYKGKVISQTDIPLQLQDGKILVPVDQVIKNSIVYIDYPQGKNARALASFITPSGRLVVAVGMCEPCRSKRFHIDGNVLVCDTCGTRWLLADLKGLSGGCPQYPPEELPYEVQDGVAIVDEALLRDWTPRI